MLSCAQFRSDQPLMVQSHRSCHIWDMGYTDAVKILMCMSFAHMASFPLSLVFVMHGGSKASSMCALQACLQYVDSLQELEGILGSDTCSQIRNDPRLKDLLLHHQSEKHKGKMLMDRQHSANSPCASPRGRQSRSTI